MEYILGWIFDGFLVDFGNQDGVGNSPKIEKIEIETVLKFDHFWKACWNPLFSEAAKTRRDCTKMSAAAEADGAGEDYGGV